MYVNEMEMTWIETFKANALAYTQQQYKLCVFSSSVKVVSSFKLINVP